MQLASQSRIAPPVAAGYAARQLLINSCGMALARAAGMLTLIVSVPVIVAHLGPQGFGVWEAMLAVAGITMIFQTVISGTMQWRIALSYGENNPVETRRLVRVGIGATLMLLLLLLPPVFFWRDSILSALHIPADGIAAARRLLPAVVGLMLLGGINESLSAVLIGYQRAGKASLIQSIGLAVSNLAAIGILLCGGGLEALLLGNLIGFAATLLVLLRSATTLCGPLSPLPALPSRRDWTVIGPFFVLLLISNLTLTCRDHTDKLVLASLASPTAVGFFGMAQRLSLMLMQVAAVFLTPFTSAVAALFARGDWHGVQELYVKIGTALGAIVGLMAVLACTLRIPLFTLWMGAPQPEVEPFLAPLLFGCASALIFSGAGVAIAKSRGRAGIETSYTLITLILTVVSKPLFIRLWGVAGAAVASALSWCIGTMFFLWLLHRRLELPTVMSRRLPAIWLATVVWASVGWQAASIFPAVHGRGEALIVLVAGSLPIAALYLGTLAVCGLLTMSNHSLAYTHR